MPSNPYGPNAGSGVYEYLKTLVDSGSSVITLGAPELASLSGAYESFMATGGVGVKDWLFDDAATQSIGGAVRLPNDWTTYDITIEWAAHTVTTGDVVWRAYSADKGAGDDLRTLTSHGNVTATSGAQGVSVATTLASGIAHTAGDRTYFQLMRRGAEAADTMTAAAGIVSVTFTKAS